MNGRRIHVTVAVMTAVLAVAGTTHGQSIDPTYQQTTMFGIRYSSGRMWKYDFAKDQAVVVDYVRDVDTGTVLTNIRGAAYFPSMPKTYSGFQQIHCFWTDPADNLTKVVHIDVETAQAKRTGINMGKGVVRGAVGAVGQSGGLRTWRVFGVQDKPQPPIILDVDGMANLNPSNNDDFEFTITTPDGTFTRDHLKNVNVQVDANGVFYSGSATLVRFKPKGNGNQNSFKFKGTTYLLNNAKAYEFSGNMNVTVFNDQIKNGKAMGHWWIGSTGESVTVREDSTTIVSAQTPWVATSRLISLHTATGLATTEMELSRLYRGLATNDGGTTFYSVSGTSLYRINPSSKTETLVGTISLTDLNGLSFVGNTLFAFDDSPDRLYAINHNNGQTIGGGAYLKVPDIGAMVFINTSEIPAKTYVAFD